MVNLPKFAAMMEEKNAVTSWRQPLEAIMMALLVFFAVLAAPLSPQVTSHASTKTEQGQPEGQQKEEAPADVFLEQGMSAVISQVITLDFSQFAHFILIPTQYAFGQGVSFGHVEVFPALLTYYRNLLLHSIMRHAP